jgi:hypothetical protein
MKIIRLVIPEHHFFRLFLAAISHDLFNEIEIQYHQCDFFSFFNPVKTSFYRRIENLSSGKSEYLMSWKVGSALNLSLLNRR